MVIFVHVLLCARKASRGYGGISITYYYMSESIHPTVDKIESLLRENGFWYERFLHEPVRTSEEAAAVRTGYLQKQGTKSLIVKVKDATGTGPNKRFVMLVVPGDKQFDKKKVKSELGFTDVRFANEDEVSQITGGILPGGVPPFGNLFELPVYVDVSVFENEKVIFNAGDRRVSIGMLSADYRALIAPIVHSFVLETDSL